MSEEYGHAEEITHFTKNCVSPSSLGPVEEYTTSIGVRLASCYYELRHSFLDADWVFLAFSIDQKNAAIRLRHDYFLTDFITVFVQVAETGGKII